MAYEFFYWPEIQGRGEFVRLALEDAGAPYIDVARGLESDGRGIPAMLAVMRGEGTSHIPFAPPFLRDGDVIVSHTAAILLYLGRRIGLAPTGEDGGLWTHQIQLTITDIVKEVTARIIRSMRTSGSTNRRMRPSRAPQSSAGTACQNFLAGSSGF